MISSLNLNFHPFPILYTERLVLKSITKNDANDIFRMRSDKKIMQFISRPMAASVNDALEYINKIQESLINKYGITWAISLRDNNSSIIGTIGFWRIVNEHYRAEIGYMLSKDFHGRGIMHEAMQPVLDYGFNVMKLHSVEADADPNNIASIKLLQKNNFVREAYLKENYYFNGEFFDTVIYSLLVQNFKKFITQSKHPVTGK
jgi:ribosomal-protein-alanine N-acetyltransferase